MIDFNLIVSESTCFQRYFKRLFLASSFLLLFSCGSNSNSSKFEFSNQNFEVKSKSTVKVNSEALQNAAVESSNTKSNESRKKVLNTAAEGTISLILRDSITIQEILSDILMAKTYEDRLYILDWNGKIYIYDLGNSELVKRIDLYSFDKYSLIYPYNFIVNNQYVEILDLAESSIYFMNIDTYEIESYVGLDIPEGKTIDPLFTGFEKFQGHWVLSLFNRDVKARFKNENALSFFDDDGNITHEAIPFPDDLSRGNYLPHMGAVKVYTNSKIYLLYLTKTKIFIH